MFFPTFVSHNTQFLHFGNSPLKNCIPCGLRSSACRNSLIVFCFSDYSGTFVYWFLLYWTENINQCYGIGKEEIYGVLPKCGTCHQEQNEQVALGGNGH